MKAITKVILAGLVALSLTACGGGSSDGDTPPTPTPPSSEPITPPTTTPPPTEPPIATPIEIETADGPVGSDIIGVGKEIQYFLIDYSVNPKKTISNDEIIWATTDESVATIDSNGTFKALSVGGVAINATYDDHYTSTFTQNIVEAYVDELILTPSTKTINVGDVFQITAKGKMSDGTIVPVNVEGWSTSNDAIADVDHSDGTVIGIASGTVTISTSWKMASGEATVTVR